jgi:hypothetical protein
VIVHFSSPHCTMTSFSCIFSPNGSAHPALLIVGQPPVAEFGVSSCLHRVATHHRANPLLSTSYTADGEQSSPNSEILTQSIETITITAANPSSDTTRRQPATAHHRSHAPTLSQHLPRSRHPPLHLHATNPSP